MLLVDFGDFPCDGAFAILSEIFNELVKGFDKPVRRFVENHCPWLLSKGFQQGLATFLHRKEPLEAESVARQAGGDYRRDAGRGSGKCLHLNSFRRACAGKKEAWIRNAWRTGVADQRDIQSAKNPFLDHLGGLVLVELVMGLEFAVNVVAVKQDAARPCVFSKDQVRVFQHLNGSESHVVQVSDRCRDYVEDSGHGFAVRCCFDIIWSATTRGGFPCRGFT